ncbi:MAG: 4-hydroxythreonine-4-phosphate dehydrogenase PdxA [Desulfofustis sp. PB-SRB1]|jgi:4-hydroxythreonine-4-phosphate dehydrogenase|nr:4-hydroxythreonine-4-phosphate dehydrogenase PdxA [Desulfofustis sp. PB-SRB1]MBM1000988.1 4-hydroxythreonine-4-phosphate dehydrogenase PdxA [Desulfofustis sp. PB-SRB1]HBH30231.1 4-hydroxythreonine-4-phosphate dehydrogenase PdxA [Desulfofustis sp.]HBH30430.1 4-hydroxythreonine-4-phosphate dehydrogenase PdxA [Desulfofustis sp.]
MSQENAYRPLLGITMGDPGGIGPEICAKALDSPEIYDLCRPLVIGETDIMADAVSFSGLSLDIAPVDNIETAPYRHGAIDVLSLGMLRLSELQLKTVSAAQGLASFTYIERAIELAMAGTIDGTVTGPINKAAINAAGLNYAGHTEIYGEKTGTRDYTMMLADGPFRVTHVSTHVSLREACDRVTSARVLAVIKLTHDTLRQLGIARPHIAVAGLNPHCGEGRLFGDEDELEIAPAVQAAKKEGIDADGPIPADTVFSKMRGGFYDAVVVMYHDQGHIPAKLVGFNYNHATGSWDQMAGVNVTLGLPIIRTSVDHGTAFGKAGEGRANPQSMLEAIKLGAQLAAGRR